jgi:hypothetical protein
MKTILYIELIWAVQQAINSMDSVRRAERGEGIVKHPDSSRQRKARYRAIYLQTARKLKAGRGRLGEGIGG